LAASIKEILGVEATLVGAGGGIFDVTVDGKLLWSKHQTGSFPDEAEFIEKLKANPA
jgi:selenoprotein W-related protein|tara:strand:+ start:5443 stop:5613 length:171 start_codon:yes stop_codon:yes gene_type:complete